MNRQEFMNQLERLLSDVPEAERQDALAYYEDYFDEAGPEQEAQAVSYTHLLPRRDDRRDLRW